MCEMQFQVGIYSNTLILCVHKYTKHNVPPCLAKSKGKTNLNKIKM